jgi:chaperonin GroEL
MIKLIQKDTFETIRSAVNKTVDLIKPTLGPASNKVIISKVLEKMTVDDGVQIARSLELEDPAENAVLNIVRESAVKTNDRVGDGTTGSLVILQALIEEAAKTTRRDGHKIQRELRKAVIEVTEHLQKLSKPVKTKEDLLKVARISFDDAAVAEVIADAWFKLGKDGVITVDRSGTMDTFAEISEGIQLNRGYISPYMITNPQRMEGVIEKPYILLTDYRLTETGDILPIMNKLAEKQIVNLVVICDNIENSALATAIINKMQGKFNLIAINIPSGGEKYMVLEDIAAMIGGKVFSEKKGDKIETCEIADLGRADRFISHRATSTIIGPKSNKEFLNKKIAELRTALMFTDNATEKAQLEKRLAFYSGKVGILKVGAATESEERALRYKVEDAVNAVQSAYRGGVVCGAGIALSEIMTSSPMLNAALKIPHKQIMDNMGLDPVVLKPGEAINVVTGKIGKFMQVGVIDPADVLIAAVESAVSIACLLLTTAGMIVEPPMKPKQE